MLVGDMVGPPLDGGSLDLDGAPAVAADEMVVVVAVGLRRLVAGDPIPGVNALHQPQVGERLERAVDGGDPDRTAGPAQLVVDVLRA